MPKVDSKNHNLEVAIIGDFQIGKSTFVNCLVGRNIAEIGKGKSTTHDLKSYQIGNGVSIIDTPGFNAPGNRGDKDEQLAREAIDHAFAVIFYVKETMGDLSKSIIDEAIRKGKRCVIVFNCVNREKWSPNENNDITTTIAADLASTGRSDSVIRIDGALVHPINALWAQFGLGLLDDTKEIKKISNYAFDDLGLIQNIKLKDEMLRLSNFKAVQRYIQNLPLEALSDFLRDKNQLFKRIADRFSEELGIRLS